MSEMSPNDSRDRDLEKLFFAITGPEQSGSIIDHNNFRELDLLALPPGANLYFTIQREPGDDIKIVRLERLDYPDEPFFLLYDDPSVSLETRMMYVTQEKASDPEGTLYSLSDEFICNPRITFRSTEEREAIIAKYYPLTISKEWKDIFRKLPLSKKELLAIMQSNDSIKGNVVIGPGGKLHWAFDITGTEYQACSIGSVTQIVVEYPHD